MVDEHKLLRDSGKSVEAQSLLDNALFNEAHDQIEADMIKGWINSAPRDVEGREAAWRMIHANRKHKDFIAARVNVDGKLAAAQLQELVNITEHKTRFFSR